MLHPSTKKLIDKISDMTGKRKIAWAEGDQGAVVYDTEGYRIALVGDPVEMVLSDALGKELERASRAELSATPRDGAGTYADIVDGLCKEAARVARGTETAIDKVLAGLERQDEAPDVFVEPEAIDLEEADNVAEAATTLEDAADDTLAVAVADAEPAAEPATASAPPLVVEEPDMAAAVASLAEQVNGLGEPAAEPDPAPSIEPSPTAFTETSPANAPQSSETKAANDETPPPPNPVEEAAATHSADPDAAASGEAGAGDEASQDGDEASPTTRYNPWM